MHMINIYLLIEQIVSLVPDFVSRWFIGL